MGSGDGPILFGSPDGLRNEEVAACGCSLIAFPKRCALAVPCEKHAGNMMIAIFPRETWEALHEAADKGGA